MALSEQDLDTNPDDDEYYAQDAYSYLNIEKSDLVIIDYGIRPFALWINGTKPSVLSYTGYIEVDDAPNVSFPFTRLASITSPEQNTSYLYHQIDGTTLAEERYEYSLGQWLSTNITVPNA